MTERTTVTLADVARHAGVSLATASRAINGSARRVRADLEARVLEAAQELRYAPNTAAQAIARGTSTTVALVIGDIADPYFASIAAGVIKAADDFGLVVTMTATGGDPVRIAAALRTLLGQRPRAVILAGSRALPAASPTERDIDDALDELVRAGAGVTALGTASHGPIGAGVRSVPIDNRGGAHALARALVEVGHRDFAILAGRPDLATPVERTAGFVAGAAEAGVAIPAERIVHGEFTRDGGYRGMVSLLDHGLQSGCVFAATDVMAVGAMAAMRERGLEPGADIAVAGYDDIAMLQDVYPPLTTVHLPLEAIGALALDVAMSAQGDDVSARAFADEDEPDLDPASTESGVSEAGASAPGGSEPEAAVTLPVQGRVILRASTGARVEVER
ncbi:LacI family DNA-binding transcriptional regulator [Curtobacterium ammoniigenes]|uniref:LacI family DNA-binding transcriptional regulator n=1 Tax=Curtobacterium ammoniigenes TaxID=395387 RepID=UPI0009FB5018|nr:LacI family DNA-binding transcriptional regulator [Curtobacterium ammoniigenes]